MKRAALILILLTCVVIITASALDLRCGAVAPAPDTLVIICRASRL